jgi:hypothetical protein
MIIRNQNRTQQGAEGREQERENRKKRIGGGGGRRAFVPAIVSFLAI